ncbi:DUF7287 family protein [Salinirussus salinus]|uniref:DUF7287 family protein n=1 Tax=Salinirussus salinus TaxID=1198300 RepID=UPI0013596921|nr:hypothetical protein [Salinirussus salinus]
MRGQTTLDFAVGAVIFVGVVGFVFLFVSSAVTPFTGNPQDDTVTTNRVADELSADLLGSPADPYVLDTFCTRAFFDSLNGGSVPADCAYENDSLNDRVGVPDRKSLNVTVVGNVTGPPTDTDTPGTLCWDEDDRRLVALSDCDTGTGDVALAAGPDPTGEDSTITARRAVSLAGRDAILVVEVW